MRGCAAATAWPWSCRTGPSSSKSPGAASFPGSTTPPVNTHFTPDEVAYVIDDSDAKAVFVDASMGDLAAHIRRCQHGVKVHMVVGGDLPGWRCL